MTEPSATPDPAAPQNTFTNSGPNYGAQGTFYGSVQVNNHGPQVNLHALLHDHTGFMADRLASFVGRADELAEVQRRIADLLPTGGYVTITGQAGQGKSSLIAKLVEGALRERVGEDLPVAQLAERAGPTALAYHFIPFQPGPDHQVGLLRNLMARLIGKYSLSDLYVATDSRPALRDYFARVLIEVAAKGAQEVIFIDGLDQIEEDASGVRDLSFLPTNPPAGIVFVLGTRPNDTLRPLELRKPHVTYWLPPLSRADFALILQHRHVTLDAHLADRFYSVMEANALYLDLVARELAQAGALPPEQIIAQVAGNPENLFSLAVERLKRPPLAWREVIKPVLGLLLAAREPLRLRAIRTLIGQPEDTVQDGLERLGGLLQRDGEGRYTLFHLKLRDYLREDTAHAGKRYVFAADEEEQWHARLARWPEEGAGLAALWQDKVGDALEQDRRAYARQHYVTHLCLAKQWPRLWEVLDAGEYAAAKLRHDPSTRSVVLDLDVVRQQMTDATRGDYEAGIAWLPRLWRYSLLRGSLASQADSYPDGLIPLLAELGSVQEAIGLAEVLTEPSRKARTLIQIGQVLSRQGQTGAAQQVYQRARDVVRSIEDGGRRAEVLGQVAAALAAGGEWELALEVARSIEDGGRRAEVLGHVAAALAAGGERELALEVARSIEDGERRTRVLGHVAAAPTTGGERDQALAVALSIEEGGWRAEALGQIAAALLKGGGRKQVLEMAWLIVDVGRHDEMLGQVAAALAAEGELEAARMCVVEALEVARSIAGGGKRAEALGQVATALAAGGERELALEVARSIEDGDWRAGALGQVTAVLAAGGEWELALEVARSIEDGGWRAGALRQVTAALAAGGEWELALEVACSIEDGERRAEALGEVAAALAAGGERELALKVALSIGDRWSCVGVLGQVAAALAAGGERELALEVARSIGDRWSRAGALGQITAALAARGELEQALEVARSIRDRWWHAGALGQIAAALAARGELEQALEVTRLIGDGERRAGALGQMAAVLLKSGQERRACSVVTEALTGILFDTGSISFAQLIRAFSQVRDPVLVFAFLCDHWSILSRRNQIIALLPAATPLIAAHPPLLQELLDGFDWVDQILKKW
ncbi:MAG TPA: AAA family ATPase [Roseiflexaceae bacterium]|nr:AAA family ATPase [Roseiflexaceae bacterium]